jgi:hypothetical protein
MSTSITGFAQVSAGDLTLDSATPDCQLGTQMQTTDGRTLVYVRAGATALVPGTLLQAPAEVTNHQDVVPAIAAIGATSITVTLGATAATANQYAQGYAVITVTPGQGYIYQIDSHPAADSSGTLTLKLVDPLEVALTAASNVDLVANPYNGVIINPTTASSAPVAAATHPITATYYGWAVKEGVVSLLSDGGTAVGLAVVASNGTAGAVETLTGTQAPIGTTLTGIATTEYGAVKIKL